MRTRFQTRSTYAAIAMITALCSTAQAPGLAQSMPGIQSEAGIQPAPAIAPAAGIPASGVASTYLLGPGDQVAITVFDYTEFTGPRVILPDGTIRLPLIGAVMAANRTPEMLAQELTARLQTYLVNPVVTISLATLRPVTVNVAGEVQRPGTVQLQGLTAINEAAEANGAAAGAAGTPPTLSAALIAAGGITSRANIRQIGLRRLAPDGSYVTTTVNLWDLIGAEQTPQDPLLQAGDSVFVPQLTAGDTIDRRLMARSSLAPATVPVRVVGEVNNPGEVQVPPNSSISSAVAIAGGPTEDARLGKVAYIRLNAEGNVERQVLDLSNLTDSYQIQEGDVIIVPKRGSSSLVDFAGRLVGPLGLFLNLLTLGLN